MAAENNSALFKYGNYLEMTVGGVGGVQKHFLQWETGAMRHLAAAGRVAGTPELYQ